MKIYLITFLTLFFLNSINVFAQVEFEKGYFIDEEGNRVECLIKNLGWRENPVSFMYKLNQSEEVLTRLMADTKEFGVGEEFRYVKYLVQVDLSSDQVEELTKDKNPDFTEKEVFLRQLIEGEFNLYNYIEGNVTRYFVSNQEVEPTQLIYKRFVVDSKVGVNSKFRGQLKYLWNCGDQVSTQKLTYGKSSLLKYVKSVYECKEIPFTQFDESSSGNFNAKIKLGYRIAKHEIETERSAGLSQNKIIEEFDASTGPVFGVEFEYILPFLKNKLSVPLNIMYQSSSYEKSNTEFYPDDHTFRMEYSSIEIYPSVRYNYFLSQTSSLGLSAGLIIDLVLTDLNELETGPGPTVLEDPFFETNSGSNFIIAGNYRNGKYYAEVSYGLNRNLSNLNAAWNSKYSYINFIVGYTLFTSK